jgi:hypothetical protein
LGLGALDEKFDLKVFAGSRNYGRFKYSGGA